MGGPATDDGSSAEVEVNHRPGAHAEGTAGTAIDGFDAISAIVLAVDHDVAAAAADCGSDAVAVAAIPGPVPVVVTTRVGATASPTAVQLPPPRGAPMLTRT